MLIREALEQLKLEQLKALAKRADKPSSGSKGELLSRLSRSFGQTGGFPELVTGRNGTWDGLLLEECRAVLGGFCWYDERSIWEARYLGELKKDDAWQLLLDIHDEDENDGDHRAVFSSDRWERFFKETEVVEDDDVDDTDAEFEDDDPEGWLQENFFAVAPGGALPDGIERYAKSHRHQDAAAAALQSWWSGPPSNGLVVLPTGAGKSFVAAKFAVDRIVANCGSVLWLAHRAELANQAVKTLLRASDATRPLSVGRFEAGARKLKTSADVVVASIPTLAFGRRGLPNLTKLLNVMKPRGFDLVVVDECHHLPASSWRRLVKGLSARLPRVRFLGLTATPFRSQESEEHQLRQFFTDVYQESPRRLIEDQVLARPRVEVVSTGVSYRLEGQELVDYRKFNELPPAALKKLSTNSGRNKFVVDTILGRNHLRPQQGWGPSLVFAISVKHAEDLAESLASSGLVARAVTGDMSPAKRAGILRAFQNGEVHIITTVMVLTEGSDLPNLRSVFLSRPINSRVLFAQAVGRAMRGPAVGGTETCDVIGFSDELSTQVDEYLGEPWTSFLSKEDGAEALGQAVDQVPEVIAPVATAEPPKPAEPDSTPVKVEPVAEPVLAEAQPTGLAMQQKRVLVIACGVLAAIIILYRLFAG